MKRKYFLGILSILFFISLRAQVIVPQRGIDAISTDEIKAHIVYLASDEMKGRNTPSPELDTCAAYISKEFTNYGLKPIDAEGSFFQYFNVLKSNLSQPNSLKIITETGETSYEIKRDFVPIYLTANRQVKAPIVFAGYGITAPEYDYDDYRDIDVRGKIVFIFTHEPQEKDSTSIFDGTKMTDYSKLINKALNARDHGAIGMLVVTDPNNHRFRRPPNVWPSLMRKAPKDAVPLTIEEKMENKLVAIRIGKELAQDFLEGTGKTMSELQTLLDSNLTPHSFEIPNKTIIMETSLNFQRTQTQNVAGLWKGNDPQLKEEIIVIGAHYDHLGAPNDSTIYNGADDNASGTVGVMAVAKAFTACERRPKRSILFSAWAGEEKGLFGSRYYTDTAPIYPHEKTVAYINFDMIGRNDSSKVNISGFASSTELKPIVETATKGIGINFKEQKEISRSDHVSFYRNRIPVLGFNTGFHEDYHKPTDTSEKCHVEGISQICKLVFKTAWMLAEGEKRPLYTDSKQ